MTELNLIGQTRLLQIADAPSRYASLAKRLVEERRNRFTALGGNTSREVHEVQLLDRDEAIVDLAEELLHGARNGERLPDSVMLDITSLPKRYFFPLLRLFEQSDQVQNLIITYTSAESYEEKEPLSESAPDGWKPLPGFLGEAPEGSEVLIVSVGFMVESLAITCGRLPGMSR
jgi:hypothetical protein